MRCCGMWGFYINAGNKDTERKRADIACDTKAKTGNTKRSKTKVGDTVCVLWGDTVCVVGIVGTRCVETG